MRTVNRECSVNQKLSLVWLANHDGLLLQSGVKTNKLWSDKPSFLGCFCQVFCHSNDKAVAVNIKSIREKGPRTPHDCLPKDSLRGLKTKGQDEVWMTAREKGALQEGGQRHTRVQRIIVNCRWGPAGHMKKNICMFTYVYMYICIYNN